MHSYVMTDTRQTDNNNALILPCWCDLQEARVMNVTYQRSNWKKKYLPPCPRLNFFLRINILAEVHSPTTCAKYLVSEFEYNHLLFHHFPTYPRSKFSYERASTTSLEQNATILGEHLQNLTSEIARNAMNLPIRMIIW